MPSNAKIILETERLVLREITTDDAAFILELINTPKFHKYIGDRGVRDVEAAREYVDDRYIKNYDTLGFGLYAVCLKDGTPIGNCGFVKRDNFEFPDIGFAFLPEHERKGYGWESAAAMVSYGKENFGFTKLLAITSLNNDASGKLLEKLGFEFTRIETMPNGEELNLYSITL